MFRGDQAWFVKGTGGHKREEFPGWKAKMQLLCMEKGDNDGIFFDAGSDPAIGYRAYQGQGSVAKKETWVNLSKKLVGKVGNKISNGQLRRIWTTELTRILQIPAELPYIFAKCMAKLESDQTFAVNFVTARTQGHPTWRLAHVHTHHSRYLSPRVPRFRR